MPEAPGPSRPDRGERRIAAVYGWDLLSGHVSFRLETLLADGFEILALDRPAVTELLERKVPFETPEDWLGPAKENITQVFSTADAALEGWSEHHPDAVSSDGLRWPDHDHWNVPSTWFSMTVAYRLAEAFQRGGVARLRFSSEHPLDSFADRQVPLRPVADLWSRMLPSVAEPVSVANTAERRNVDRLRRTLSASPLGGPLRAVRSAANSRRFFTTARALLGAVDRSRLVLLLLPARELDRSGPIIDRLHRHLGDSLVAVPWMDSDELTAEAGELNAVDWLPTPRLERGLLGDERRLAAGILRNLGLHQLGELEPAREEIGAALQLLAGGWAAHARRLRWTVRMLRELRPQLVVTARDALPYQVPTEAAWIARIPVITLPHGVIEWSPPTRLEPRPGVIHVGGIRNPTAPPGALRICHDTLIQYEYPRRAREFNDDSSADVLRVLVLTEGFGGVNAPSMHIRSHQRGLKALETAARTAGPSVRFRLKPHPADPEDEFQLMRQGEHQPPCFEVLPREADVIAAIGASELIVGVNYVGSALFHAVSAGVPVVRLTTNEVFEVRQSILTDGTAWAAFWDRMLLSVEDADGLVDVLRRMKDPAFVEELRQRSHDAAAALRPDADAPSIIDVVEEILATRTAQNS